LYISGFYCDCLAYDADTGSIKVGLVPSKISVYSGSSFKINLTIFNMANKIIAGEFKLNFPSKYISHVNLTLNKYWVCLKVSNKYVFYRKPGVNVTKGYSVIVTLMFSHNSSFKDNFNISLVMFKAADKNGNDLQVEITEKTVAVSIMQVSSSNEGQAGGGSEASLYGTGDFYLFYIAIMISLSVASVILVSALYLRSKQKVLYYLITPTGMRIPVNNPKKIFGREDFVGYIPRSKLIYITRTSKGGQFTIIRLKNSFYIIDKYSKNPTMVNRRIIKGLGYVRLNNGDVIEIPGVIKLIFYQEK